MFTAPVRHHLEVALMAQVFRAAAREGTRDRAGKMRQARESSVPSLSEVSASLKAVHHREIGLIPSFISE
jgi:hypothetical protein